MNGVWGRGGSISTVGLRSTVGEPHAHEWITELRIIASAKWAGPEMIDEKNSPTFLYLFFIFYFLEEVKCGYGEWRHDKEGVGGLISQTF